jgi:hypothetical protein
MAYRIAGIDVHKKMLAVVVADVEGEGEYQFERRQFGTTPDHLRLLSEWFVEQEVEEVVMESTAHGRKSRGSKQSLDESVPLSPRTLQMPLSSKIASSSLAEREGVPLVMSSRVAGYRGSPRGKQRRPIIRSTTHAPDQTILRPRLIHCADDLIRSEFLLSPDSE